MISRGKRKTAREDARPPILDSHRTREGERPREPQSQVHHHIREREGERPREPQSQVHHHIREREGERPREPLTHTQGWRRAHLGDVLNLRKDVVHPRNKPHGRATFVGLEHIESGTGNRVGAVELVLANLTGRKPRIRTQEVAQVPLTLPPLPTQRALAARLQAEITAATALRTSLESRLATLERLPAALLRQVFGDADAKEDDRE